MNRRNLLLGLGAALAAPAIIRTAGLIMPVHSDIETWLETQWALGRTIRGGTYTISRTLRLSSHYPARMTGCKLTMSGEADYIVKIIGPCPGAQFDHCIFENGGLDLADGPPRVSPPAVGWSRYTA